MAHCKNTTVRAHFPPSSLLIEAIAAIHGVYSRQKTNRLAAESGVMLETRTLVFPKRMDKVETTLSFAKNPVIRAVAIRQSPSPIGFINGAISPEIIARMLSFESVTIFKCRLKVCKNQMTKVAMKITVKALCRKSFALSQRR